METNKIIQGDCLTELKKLPDESINCCMTSPPYWALRDYGTANWEGGNPECNHVINKISELQGDWERPSRIEFNKVGEVLECVVCKKQFKGKLGNKFCSTECLNTLSNEDRTNAQSKRIEICSLCGAKRVDKQLGLEPTFQEYINKLCDIFDEVKRVLRKDGTLWVNIGDTYSNNSSYSSKGRQGYEKKEGMINHKIIEEKSLCNIPARFSIEMQNRGWILRNVIIWHKPNCMPSSVKDRFTVDFEYLYFFVKSKKYWFETIYEPYKDITTMERYYNCSPEQQAKMLKRRNSEFQKVPTGSVGVTEFGRSYKAQKKELLGRNKRAVWTITTKPFKEAHFATYPEALCETPIKAGCPIGGVVLDPFFGAGTTGLVALKQNKKFIGIELNPKYIEIAMNRLKPFMEQKIL